MTVPTRASAPLDSAPKDNCPRADAPAEFATTRGNVQWDFIGKLEGVGESRDSARRPMWSAACFNVGRRSFAPLTVGRLLVHGP